LVDVIVPYANTSRAILTHLIELVGRKQLSPKKRIQNDASSNTLVVDLIIIIGVVRDTWYC
jgi:hypothetical protein